MLLKSFEKWLAAAERNPQTRAGLRQEFEDFVTAAQERQRSRFAAGEVAGKKVADTRGSVRAAVRVPDPRPGLGQVMGRNLDDTLAGYRAALKGAGLEGSAMRAAAEQAERVLSGFLKAWESRRSAQEIQKIMDPSRRSRRQYARRSSHYARPERPRKHPSSGEHPSSGGRSPIVVVMCSRTRASRCSAR